MALGAVVPSSLASSPRPRVVPRGSSGCARSALVGVGLPAALPSLCCRLSARPVAAARSSSSSGLLAASGKWQGEGRGATMLIRQWVPEVAARGRGLSVLPAALARPSPPCCPVSGNSFLSSLLPAAVATLLPAWLSWPGDGHHWGALASAILLDPTSHRFSGAALQSTEESL